MDDVTNSSIEHSTSNTTIDEVISDVDFISSNNETLNLVLHFWESSLQNVTSPSPEEEEEADLPFLLSVRLAIIFGVIVGISILAFGSYAVHRKRVKNSKKQKYHKTLLLDEI